jgi:hypothetical protein
LKRSEPAAETPSPGAGLSARATAGRGAAPFRKDADAGYAVKYADPGYVRLGRVVVREKRCPTKSAALRFCVLLRQLGGSPIELLHMIPGQASDVLTGRALEEEIRQLAGR